MWKLRLLKDMKNPEMTVFSDDQIVVLRDKYPKAQVHFLVLPRKDISSLTCVQKVDIDLLKYMNRKAEDIIQEYGPGRIFKCGYHAIPSMERLHLHVISDDFISDSLKRKSHWNSFNTPWFMDSTAVIKELERSGTVTIPAKEILESFIEAPLQCHKCHFAPKNLPDLKRHLLSHCS